MSNLVNYILWTNDCPHCDGTGKIYEINPIWLYSKRKKLGLKLREVATATDFSISYISDMERGYRKPHTKVVQFYLKELEEK